MTWCFITHFECRCRRWLMIDCNRGLGCQPWWPTLYYLVVLFWSPVLSGPWLVGWKEKKTEIKTNHSSDCPYTNLAPPSLTPPQLPLISAPCEAGSLTPWLPVSLAPWLPVSLSPWLPASWLPVSLAPWLPGSLAPGPLEREHAAVHAGGSQRSNILPEYEEQSEALVAKRALVDRREPSPESFNYNFSFNKSF